MIIKWPSQPTARDKLLRRMSCFHSRSRATQKKQIACLDNIEAVVVVLFIFVHVHIVALDNCFCVMKPSCYAFAE